jgi:hypothetical protein
MIALRGVLSLITTVPYCSLGSNNIGSEGAVALAGALQVNSAVPRLMLVM